MPISPYLRFQTPELEQQWQAGVLHPALAAVVLFAARLHFLYTRQPALITSLYRPGDPGVHGQLPCQGADLSVRFLAGIQKDNWPAAINEAFPYVYTQAQGKQTALVHEAFDSAGNSRGPVHLHLQVGPLEPTPEMPESFIV